MELHEVIAFIYPFLPKAGSSIPSATIKTQHCRIFCAALNLSSKTPWRSLILSQHISKDKVSVAAVQSVACCMDRRRRISEILQQRPYHDITVNFLTLWLIWIPLVFVVIREFNEFIPGVLSNSIHLGMAKGRASVRLVRIRHAQTML